MVFSSLQFIFYFLPLVLLLYYVAPRRARHLILTLVSYVFYGWANPLFVVLMLVSTLIDYVCGLAQWRLGGQPWREEPRRLPSDGRRTRGQRIAVTVSIVSNLSLLGFFKYFNFAAGSMAAVTETIWGSAMGLDRVITVVLPLGISFYTFQSMSYAIDVYRGDARPMKNFIDFACYVAMFPQLVAGPIIRFSEVADQFASRTHSVSKFARGIAFVSVGLAKKILLANPCGKIADMVFETTGMSVLDAWYGVTAYAFQIYFDFSGYSDVAIGLGLMLGFMFAKNFDSPYHARSITEFWRRWHISLSSWLRDYLYIPLGGNRRSAARTYTNLMLVMLLGGLWHGAAWTFVAWGTMHGLMLCGERLIGRGSMYRQLPGQLQTLLTFVLVLFSWVFFRAPDLRSALVYCGRMLGFGAGDPHGSLPGGLIYQPYYLGTFLIAAFTVWCLPQTWDWSRRLTPARAGIVLLALGLAIVALTTQTFNPFIYFIF